jgi:hypothetical protein
MARQKKVILSPDGTKKFNSVLFFNTVRGLIVVNYNNF